MLALTIAALLGAVLGLRVFTDFEPARAVLVLRITGPGEAWSLHYLELATHHGSSSGLFKAFMLPRDKEVRRVSALTAIAAGVGVAAFLLLPVAPAPRGLVRGTHLAISGVVVATLALVTATPWISPFKVVIAPHTWVLCLAILAGPRTFALMQHVPAAVSPRVRRAAAATLIAGAVAAAGAQVVRRAAET